MDKDFPQAVVCPGCEREIPNGSVYCPHCCGEDGREGAIKRGGYIGAIFGLMVGGLVAALWSSIVGPERATWGVTLGVVLACVTTGMIWGMIHQRGK